jgi:hypothetical protein
MNLEEKVKLFISRLDKIKMMWMKRLISAGVAFLFCLTLLEAKDFRIDWSGGLFYPTEKAFRSIYGEGIIYGLDVSRYMGKNLEFHIACRYFTKKGRLTFTQEKTTIKLLPLSADLRYIFLKRKVNLYAGAGLIYDLFEEKNPIGKVREHNLGYTIKIGAYKKMRGFKKIIKALIVDFQIEYHYCKMRPVEIRFDAGGTSVGIALGTEF